MILELTYEELTALNKGAESLRAIHGGGVAAPPDAALSALEERLPIRGDLRVSSATEHDQLLQALDAVLGHLKKRMDELLLEQYVGSEDAIIAYFDYANVLTARHRLEELGRAMKP